MRRLFTRGAAAAAAQHQSRWKSDRSSLTRPPSVARLVQEQELEELKAKYNELEAKRSEKEKKVDALDRLLEAEGATPAPYVMTLREEKVARLREVAALQQEMAGVQQQIAQQGVVLARAPSLEEAKRFMADHASQLAAAPKAKWCRPTPRPAQLYRTKPMLWPGTLQDCDRAPLPTAADLSVDGRTLAIGIGNAFGTGKTEVAINGAELTAAAEPGVEVAYMSLGNGYADHDVTKTVRDTGSEPCSKYAGLWLFAAKLATKVTKETDGRATVVTSAHVFKSVVSEWAMRHELDQWPLPRYGDEAHEGLIVIIDEVQEFAWPQLDSFVTSTVITAATRMTLLVGAFLPQFVFGSRNRVLDLDFDLASNSDMETLFKEHVLGGASAPLKESGVSLPSLFGSAIRPLISTKGLFRSLQRSEGPIRACERLYSAAYGDRCVPGLVFQAAVAGVPISAKRLKQLFQQDSTSLGAAFLSRDKASDGYHVHLPPLAVSAANGIDLEGSGLFDDGEAGTGSVYTCRDVLTEFVRPTWSSFQELSTLAPALRLAALSQPHYRLAKRSPFDFVFGSARKTPAAAELLDMRNRRCMRVFCTEGSNATDFESHLAAGRIVHWSHRHDHKSDYDAILLIPIGASGTPRYIVLFSDAKFTLSDRHLFRSLFEEKLAHFTKAYTDGLQSASGFAGAAVLIVSNHVLSPTALDDIDQPVILCGRDQLPDCLSPALVPPSSRNKPAAPDA